MSQTDLSRVDLVLHYRYGNEVKKATITDVAFRDALLFIDGLGDLRPTDGIVKILGSTGLQAMVPARNIEFVEVENR